MNDDSYFYMKRGTKKEQEARRMLAIPLFEQGIGPTEIASRLGVSQGAVSQWKKRWKKNGKKGLVSKPHPGRIPSLSEKDLKRLVEILEKGAISNGFSNDLWTLPRVAKVIKDNFGVHYHDAHMSRILKKIKWTRQKPTKYAKEKNEEEVKKWRNENWAEIKARCQR